MRLVLVGVPVTSCTALVPLLHSLVSVPRAVVGGCVIYTPLPLYQNVIVVCRYSRPIPPCVTYSACNDGRTSHMLDYELEVALAYGVSFL